MRTPLMGIAERANQLPRDFLALVADERHLVSGGSAAATLPTVSVHPRTDTIGALICYPIDLARVSFTIGRSRGNDIIIFDQHISGRHALLEVGFPRTYWVSDLGSSNGTRVGGRVLAHGEAGRAMVKVGEVFTLASFPLTLVDREMIAALADAAAQRR